MPAKTISDPIERRAMQDERKRREALKALRLPADLRAIMEAAIIEAQAVVEARR